MGLTFNFFVIESFDSNSSDFKSVLDLIKYIREISGKYFCIGIAGFCECDDEKILQMKEKIDAGAEFIVTQAFFDVEIYRDFLTRCAKAGINVPVIPGVFSFETLKQLTNFTNMCKLKVSDNIIEYLKTNNDRETVGAEITKTLIQTISSEFPAAHVHFFTINKLENVCRLLK